jgi:hypothetical protein
MVSDGWKKDPLRNIAIKPSMARDAQKNRIVRVCGMRHRGTEPLVAELCQLWSRPDPTPRNTMGIPLQAVTVANAYLTKQSDNSKSNALPEKGFTQGALGQGNTLVTGLSAGGSKTYDSY